MLCAWSNKQNKTKTKQIDQSCRNKVFIHVVLPSVYLETSKWLFSDL